MISRRPLLACLLSLAIASPVLANTDRGARDDAAALNGAVVAHNKKVALEQAVKDFGTDRANWMPKDLDPFVMEFGATMRFHISEKLIGRMSLDVRHANGKEFGPETVAAAMCPKASGRADDEFAHPASKKVEHKTPYVQRVPGAELFVGVGIHC